MHLHQAISYKLLQTLKFSGIMAAMTEAMLNVIKHA